VERIAQMASSKIEVEQVPHEAFKQRSRVAKAIIRTGECSPYANVILHSGVIF
jgi:D-ribose pyranase